MASENPFKKILKQLKSDSAAAAKSTAYLPESLNRQRLQALYLVSQSLNTILDPTRLFREVINQIVELMKAERVVILLREDAELKIQIAHNIDDQSEQNALNFSRSVVSKVMNEYQPLYSTNALDDSRFDQFQTIQQLEILSFICVPILIGEQVIGTIYVDNRHLTNVFEEPDVRFLQAFANLLGIAIRNSLAYRQVEDLNQSLEQKVKARTKKLRQTIRELESTRDRLIQTEKMAGVGRLVAGFMHEFNNPINFIYSNLPYLESYCRDLVAALDELLEEISGDRKEKILKEKDLEFLKKDLLDLVVAIKEGAERSRKIVEDLRQFSGAGTQTEEIIRWDENLKVVLGVFKDRLDKPVEVDVRTADNLTIQGSRAELNHALLNLLQNAVDAGAKEIEVWSGKRKGELFCEIKDNGAGIPEKNLNKIFDPFFTTKDVGQGMGLGLSIVYSTIDHHGGRLEVESAKNKGTVFKIYLPLVK